MHRSRLLLHLALCAFAILGAGALRAEELHLIARHPIQGEFRHIRGFDVDRQGNLLVADEAPAVVRIDPTGRRIGSYSKPGKRYCEISRPTAIAATVDGFVVFDFAKQDLLRFGPDGECQSDELLRTFQAGHGALRMSGSRLIGGGSLMKLPPEGRCVFFSTDSAGASPACLLMLKDDKLWLLYGQEFVAASNATAYYMVPYEPVLYISNGTTPARAVSLAGLGVGNAVIPPDELQIRMSRDRYYDFYNRQAVIEGVAATRAGVVVATRTPGKEQRVDLRYFKDGSTTASAAASLTIAPVTGAFPLHVVGDGNDRVYVLIAKGTYPSLQYEAVVYQLR